MTIRDVAEYCGVSISTVSRVLNNRPDVSKDVRRKVLDAIQTLHYVPNNSARDLVMTTSDSIGVVIRGAGNPFYIPVMHAIEESIEKAGYTMIISQIPSQGDELAAGASLARSKRLNGLIFLGGQFDYSQADVAALDIPFICCTYANTFGSLNKDSFSSVSIDDEEESKKAVQALIEKGHKKVGIILDQKDDHSIGQLRYMGYLNALKEAGIDPDDSLVEEIGEYDMEAAYKGTTDLLKRRSDITAIFVIADSLAIAAMKAIHDMGKSVPEDYSVISIDGLEMARYSVPTLTTLVQPNETIGTNTVRILTNVIEGKGGHEHLRFAAELEPGGTVADISQK